MLTYVILAAVVFGICFALDKLFTRVFRAKAQHRSGMSVKVSRHYASVGIVLILLGISALFVKTDNFDLALTIGGGFVIVLGVCLIGYYLTFGVYYDESGFVLSQFGKKSNLYPYAAIQAQQLYKSGSTTVIELYLEDGRTVMLQSVMDGAYKFLDYAFARWCAEKGVEPESCAFHDPSNSLWFPRTEDA